MPSIRLIAAIFLPLLVLLAGPGLAQTPLLNEFMARNATTIADDDGDYSDWVELYNASTAAYDLAGHYLSDDADNPLRWQFPTGTIPPQGYLLVWASGKDRVGPNGALHTNFAIAASGEPLLLTAPDGITRLDEVGPVALATDISYGRLPDGADLWVTFGVSTPGSANTDGLRHLDAPIFCEEPGFFSTAIMLDLTATDPEAEIRYTLDGSEPTQASFLYEDSLLLDSRIGDPNTISLIPTNFRDPSESRGWRPPRGEVFKINVVRARAFRAGHAPSGITTGSYIIDPDLTAQLFLPVISLATSPENLFDDEIGIYVPGNHYVPGDHWTGNYYQRGIEWERPIHIEFFDLMGNLAFSQDSGGRIHGGFSRSNPQKTLRMYARSEYGASRFNSALFPDLSYDSYNRFLIRNADNDSRRMGFWDYAIQTMVGDMGFDTQAGRPVVHFINGEYWGVANLRERYDRHYIVRCYGVPEDKVVLLHRNAEVEEGVASDRADYLALRSFVTNNDMTQPNNLAFAAERIDLDNFIAYNVAEIYVANYDWPGNNIRFWRKRTTGYVPDAPYGHDGRWRWLMYDLDAAFYPAGSSASFNALAHATATDSGWPNPPWSTELLRGLLENEWFQNSFINSFADHMNSTFIPARLVGIIDEFAELYAPAIPEWHDRWDINRNWTGDVQALRNFANQRPAHQRQHIIDHFDLAGTTSVTLEVNDPSLGKLQLNQLVIDHDLPGLANPAQPYPWGGTYYQGVPITVTALPEPGYHLRGWIGHDGDETVLTLLPDAAPINLTAIFAEGPTSGVAIQAWHFNDLPDGTLTEIAADLSLFGPALITYPGTGAGYLDRVDDGTLLGALPDTPAGYALRVRNPSDTRELLVQAPTIGHEDVAVSYAVKRTTNGAQEHSVHCRTAEDGPWHLVAESVTVSEDYQLFVHDLSVVDGTANNAALTLRFTFGGENASGSSGNQRFDNLVVSGVVIPGANLPPAVTGPVALQHAIEAGDELTLDLTLVFTDPDGDPLAFTAESDDPQVAQASLAGAVLTLTPLVRGDARVTVTADDGNHPPVPHTFRALIHPAAAVLADGAYTFTEWDLDLPERTYPEHMLFLQSDIDDPGLEEPLLYPYWIPHDDYHADDQGTIGFPYNNTGRTRINGLGQDGISFINTGRGRDLGGALLALDTREVSTATVSWLAGTILPNERLYAIRLQYRVGLEGTFSDVLDAGEPVEYRRSEIPGDVQTLGPVVLPASLMQQPYVQLLWRYYHVEGESGPRAELRLDDIAVTAEGPTSVVEPQLPLATVLHGAAPNPFNPATEIRFSVRQGETARLDIYNSRGQLVRTLGRYEAGEHRAIWDGTDAQGQRCASGVYFCRLQAPSGSQTRKVLMLK
jgi:hypothetical protein